MAFDRLRVIAELEAQGFVKGSKEMQAELGRMEKSFHTSNQSIKRQGQTYTQLAYALDDAQYGFKGVQNNLQQIAITAGASGPVVLGITALLIVMGKVIESFEGANKELTEARKNFERLTEVVLSSDQQIIESGSKIQENNEKTLAQLKKQLEAGTTLSHIRKDGVAVLRELSDAEREQLETSIAGLEETIGKNETLIQQAKDRIAYEKRLKEIRDSENITEFASERGLGIDESGFTLGNIWKDTDRISQIPPLLDPEVLEESIDALEDLESALEMVGSSLAGLSLKQSEAIMKAKEDYASLKESIQENFAGTIISAFESAAASGENFFASLGKGLLSAMGSLLIQIGTAAIISGKARVAAGDVTGAAAIKEGILSVAAGVALKAGGAISGKGKSGGGGSYQTTNTAALSAPNTGLTQVQGIGNNVRTIGEVRLRGQDIIANLQAGNRIRTRKT